MKEYIKNIIAESLKDEVDVDREWERLFSSIEKKTISKMKTRRLFLQYMKYAAAVVLGIGVSLSTLYLTNQENLSTVGNYKLVTSKGEKSYLQLPDGTRVWINSCTTLEYAENYGHSNRSIYLDGEAYFEVAKNKDLPFVVKANGIDVKAIGTAFNVSAYMEDSQLTTTLFNGKVAVQPTLTKQEVLLEPNQVAVYDKSRNKNLLAELNYKRFMFKKLCILLIFSKLKVTKLLIDKYRMHNLYAIFAKLLNICKQIAGNLVNESGNVPRRGVVPKFSDLEVVALNMASEAVGIDSESLLFAKLQEYRVEIPNLISRRQYNDRRKITSSLCNAIRERMVSKMDGGEDYFCIDSKPIEVCRIARSKRCSMGKKDFRKAPGVGYCASQSMYYYGYKLHAVCWLSGIIHSFDLTKASVHDIHYLKDVKVDYSNCTVIGDRGYISAQVQLDLFETANIRLEVPYRCNQKEWKPTFPAFAKARKRIETLFSQLCDQFMIIRNYAKDTDGLFARIIGKISALTILQYINYKNEKPIGRVKYALF